MKFIKILMLVSVFTATATAACSKRKDSSGSKTTGAPTFCDELNADGNCDSHIAVDVSDNKFYATASGSARNKPSEARIILKEHSGDDTCAGATLLSSDAFNFDDKGTKVTKEFDASGITIDKTKNYVLVTESGDQQGCVEITFQ